MVNVTKCIPLLDSEVKEVGYQYEREVEVVSIVGVAIQSIWIFGKEVDGEMEIAHILKVTLSLN